MPAMTNEYDDVRDCGLRPGVAWSWEGLIDRQGPPARERAEKDRSGSAYVRERELEVAEKNSEAVRQITLHGPLLGICVSNRIVAEVLWRDFLKESRKPY
jgi:hypothetical protein